MSINISMGTNISMFMSMNIPMREKSTHMNILTNTVMSISMSIPTRVHLKPMNIKMNTVLMTMSIQGMRKKRIPTTID
jgi:hypothetical protein